MHGYLLFFSFGLAYSILLAMVVLPVNPQTGEVWKAINTSCNIEEKGAKFFQYFNEGAYSANDVILSSNISSKAKPLYFSGCYENDKAGKNGLLYRFIHDYVIFSGYDDHDMSQFNELILYLNPYIKHKIYIVDQKLQFVSSIPNLFPRSVIEFNQNNEVKTVFLKVDIFMKS